MITLNGEVLRDPFVTYPINLGQDGNLLVNVVIPATDASVRSGNLTLQVTDTGGRAGTIPLTIQSPTVVFDPVTGYPGETIQIGGTGFPTSNATFSIKNSVDIEYRYVVNEGTGSEYYVGTHIGQVPVDDSGAFSTEFIVPQQAKVPSSNVVIVTPKQGETVSATHTVPGPAATADPSAAFNNQQVEITVKGFPPYYTLQATTVTLGEVRMPVPGYFGVPGMKPQTDKSGKATFDSAVPALASVGLQQLQVHLPDGSQVTNTLEVLNATLAVTPQDAVPGQTVRVSSNELSSATTEAPGPLGNHQVSGKSPSLVTFGGQRIGRTQVNYPIELDIHGGISFELTVPINDMTMLGGEFEIEVIDTGGRKGVGRLTIKRPRLTVSPRSSPRGSSVEVVGEGFVATTEVNSSIYRIDVDYGGEQVATVVTNSEGSFEATFRVPATTAVGSANWITAAAQQLSMEARIVHEVPGPAITFQPKVGPPGTILTVNGSGFPAFIKVLPKLSQIWLPQSPVVYTDVNGSFTVFPLVPAAVPLGPVILSVQVGGVRTDSLFEVTESK